MPIATKLFNKHDVVATYMGIYDGTSTIGVTAGYTDFLILDNGTETKLATVVDGGNWTPGSAWSGAAGYQIRDGTPGGSGGYQYGGYFKDNDNNLLFVLDDSSGNPGIARATISKNALLFNLPTS